MCFLWKKKPLKRWAFLLVYLQKPTRNGPPTKTTTPAACENGMVLRNRNGRRVAWGGAALGFGTKRVVAVQSVTGHKGGFLVTARKHPHLLMSCVNL